MDEERFYGMPAKEVEQIRAEGKELIPIGRDVPWHVTEAILERSFPDPERRLHVYRNILELLRKESVIPKRFFEVIPEDSDLSQKVVNLTTYRERRSNT